MLIGARVGAWSGGSKYSLVDYVTADSTAWIDSGFVPVASTKVEAKMSLATNGYVANPTGRCYFGALSADYVSGDFRGKEYFVFFCAHSDRRYYFKTNAARNDYWNRTANDGNEYYDGRFHVFEFIPASKIVIDGTKEIFAASSSNGLALPSPVSIGIFGAKRAGDGAGVAHVQTNAAMKVSYMKFYNNSTGVLLADLRAATDGTEYGLLDMVSGEFHGGRDGVISGGSF